MERTYLEISIHDNDFSMFMEIVCKHIYNCFCGWSFPEMNEENIEKLKDYISDAVFGLHAIWTLGVNTRPIEKSYFRPDIKIVDGEHLKDWDNGETFYVPLFEGSDVLSV